jgi:AraC-like DNA-binding protein
VQAVPLVRSSSVLPLIDFLERIGAPTSPSLRHASRRLRGTVPVVPLAYAGALWAEAAHVSGIPALGLRAAEATPVEEMGDLGWRVLVAHTVGEAIATLIRVSRRINTGQWFWMILRGGQVHLHRRFSTQVRSGRQIVNDFALEMLIALIRRAAGPGWRPAELQLEGPPPPHAEELAARAERRVVFEQRTTVLVFPRAVLGLPLPAHAAPLRPVSDGLSDPSLGEDFPTSVRQAITSFLHVGIVELGLVSDSLGMSERSFQRRLAAAGLRFSGLIEESRFAAAARLLREPGRQVVEIAAELGYADAANFTRAFRRWAGVPPREYRRRLVAPPALAGHAAAAGATPGRALEPRPRPAA